MTREEFIKLTNEEVNAEEYQRIDEVYMMTDFEKTEFCAYWQMSPVLLRKYAKLFHKHEVLTKRIKEVAQLLIAQEKRHNPNELRDIAIEMLGERNYLKFKLESQLPLTKEDYELLKDLL